MFVISVLNVCDLHFKCSVKEEKAEEFDDGDRKQEQMQKTTKGDSQCQIAMFNVLQGLYAVTQDTCTAS